MTLPHQGRAGIVHYNESIITGTIVGIVTRITPRKLRFWGYSTTYVCSIRLGTIFARQSYDSYKRKVRKRLSIRGNKYADLSTTLGGTWRKQSKSNRHPRFQTQQHKPLTNKNDERLVKWGSRRMKEHLRHRRFWNDVESLRSCKGRPWSSRSFGWYFNPGLIESSTGGRSHSVMIKHSSEMLFLYMWVRVFYFRNFGYGCPLDRQWRMQESEDKSDQDGPTLIRIRKSQRTGAMVSGRKIRQNDMEQ